MELPHRGQVLERLEEVKARFDPKDAETRFELAHLLYQVGSFPEAQEMLQPLKLKDALERCFKRRLTATWKRRKLGIRPGCFLPPK